MIKEIILLAIGAVIGVLSSIGTLYMERWFNRRGKMRIYYKIYSADSQRGKPFAFIDKTDGYSYFYIPVFFELQNTSNWTRILRDLSIVMYLENKPVAKMIQINDSEHNIIRDGEIVHSSTEEYGSEQGSYSFMIQPTSIQKAKCLYLFKVKQSEKNKWMFDSIYLEYYDERNKKQ